MELSEMLVKARANLWLAQQRMGVKPEIRIVINGEAAFLMSVPDIWRVIPHIGVAEPYLKIYINPEKLDRMLRRELHFNNLEVAGDVIFDRCPNVYMPDVHTMMSFFHV